MSGSDTNTVFPNLAMLQTISGKEIVGTAIYPNPIEVAATASFLGSAPLILNYQPNAYTLQITDTGFVITHPLEDNSSRVYTIPANSSVQFPLGTCLTFCNEVNTVFIAINGGDTLQLAGSAATGTRTLAAFGIATAIKTAATRWMISGANLT